ncbi:type II toxin-antitoxin system VapC family toxin [Polaromonas sp.]|uniref:type II toxin-antitoxin system VapC family toxin n=1 Tax=Polaromonas sp. TaxID=1869339 RepID=UPI0032658FEE
MSYLIDTNVLSELVRPKPSAAVLRWFANTPDDALFLSALTLGEIRKGVEKMADIQRREKLRLWLEHDLRDWFGPRILPIGTAVADHWGRLLAQVGRPVPAIDSLLAATALHHDLRLVTRNTKDFVYAGLELVNPWLAAVD